MLYAWPVTDEAGTVKAHRPSHPPLCQLIVRVVEGPDRGLERSAGPDESIAVGASPDNELSLRDSTVSRYHAELHATPAGIAVRDLGSLNGTFVGAVRVDAATVPPGTKLRLGATVLAVEEAGGAARSLEQPSTTIPGLVAQSAAMHDVVRAIERLAPRDVSVLLSGETGAGKEIIARAIHELSARRTAPFVVVDCGSMASTLVSSELFGHERGSFTSAERRRIGAFERAHGGTLFLDEIGELPLDVQPALLGALERRRFRRVGGEEEIEVDVRILAATHRDLRHGANSGTFRPDLYFRLAVARLVVPPLRERQEDIPLLIERFVEELTGAEGAQPFDPIAIEQMKSHPWSGNVRELRNVVESALAMGEVVLDAGGGPIPVRSDRRADEAFVPYRDARTRVLTSFERNYLGSLIEACGGNASEAARRAHMDRPYLLTLLKRHGLR